MNRRTLLLGAALAPLVASGRAFGQAWPDRSVRIIVPFAAGSFTDIAARLVATELTEQLGQPVIVENRGGGGSTAGTLAVVRAEPDGYTLLLTDISLSISPAIYPKLPYDPLRDLVQISRIANSPALLMVRPGLGVKTLAELVALAKQKPGEINYGTFGVGSSGHLNMELFQALSGAKFQAVHYKGATPALTDVMAGHIQMMFISVGSAVPQWKADKVKFLAVGAAKRMALLPEIPTVAESGLPGYEAISWFGLFGPPGMPADVVTKINAEVRKIFADPEIKKSFLERQYFESIAGTPEQLTNYIKADEPKWRKVIEDAKVKGE